MKIQKLLIANRGEIACRIMRTAQDLGIATIAVYSDADAEALHVKLADVAVRIGAAPAAESYLLGDVIVEAAMRHGADAIHPGYGFLSENPTFVEAVETAGLTFVGPSAGSIRAMGLKDKAKTLMEAAGVPVVPGYHGDAQDGDFLKERAAEIGYPVLIKARAGGGGKGMRLVECANDFDEALASAQREAQSSFGDPVCLIEKYVQKPRHIEIQVFGDSHGNVVHLFERDCSLQRRHQKVIEEAPAPGMTEALRSVMGAAAVRAAKAVDYVGAGTVEFIVDGAAFPDEGSFWFMEMNTRLQVEHPVTEAISGLDLVKLQLRIAEGEQLPFSQDDLTIDGHAFEARLYAENAAAGFLPAVGRLDRLDFPNSDQGVRVDAGVQRGDWITPHYDPMIAKIVVHSVDRSNALGKLRRALEETVISGTETNRAFLLRLAQDGDFARGEVDTGLIGRKHDVLTTEPELEALDYAFAAIALLTPLSPKTVRRHAFDAWPNFRLFGKARQTIIFDGEEPAKVTLETDHRGEHKIETPLGPVSVNKTELDEEQLVLALDGCRLRARTIRLDKSVLVQRRGLALVFALEEPGGTTAHAGLGSIEAPMPGRILDVHVKAGDMVQRDDALVVLEAMKMEHTLTASRDGIIAEVMVKLGDQVNQGTELLTLEEDG